MSIAMNKVGATIVQTLQITALLVGVTVAGLAGGAFLMSPAMSTQNRLLVAGGVIGTLVLAAFAFWMKGVLAARKSRGARTAAAAAPSIAQRSGQRSSPRNTRTPKAVQALAANGAAPMEIAHKTGLPFDAVAMLLELTPSR